MSDFSFGIPLIYVTIMLLVIAMQKKHLGVAFFDSWPEEKEGFSTLSHFLYVIIANAVAASFTLIIIKFVL